MSLESSSKTSKNCEAPEQEAEKGQTKNWDSLTEEEMTAFEILKDKLVDLPILTIPEENRPLIFDADACQYQLACVLLQQQKDLKTRLPLGFLSRTLESADKTTTKQTRIV